MRNSQLGYYVDKSEAKVAIIPVSVSDSDANAPPASRRSVSQEQRWRPMEPRFLSFWNSHDRCISLLALGLVAGNRYMLETFTYILWMLVLIACDIVPC